MISRGSRTGTRVGLIGWFGNRVWRVINHDVLPEPVPRGNDIPLGGHNMLPSGVGYKAIEILRKPGA